MNNNAYGPPPDQMFAMGLTGMPPRPDLTHHAMPVGPLGMAGADRVTGMLPGQLPGTSVAIPQQPSGASALRPGLKL